MARALLVLTTADSDELALRLADALIERRQAACVNIVRGITSVYRWQGEVSHEPECLLLIKTLETRFEAVAATLRELHDYDLPEVVAVPADRIDEAYLRWVVENIM